MLKIAKTVKTVQTVKDQFPTYRPLQTLMFSIVGQQIATRVIVACLLILSQEHAVCQMFNLNM